VTAMSWIVIAFSFCGTMFLWFDATDVKKSVLVEWSAGGRSKLTLII